MVTRPLPSTTTSTDCSLMADFNGKLPGTSPFGNMRFIPIERLFHTNTNIYFADFYCTSYMYYVTIIVCTPGTEADEFCASHLPSLDPVNNPFLCIDLFDGLLIWQMDCGQKSSSLTNLISMRNISTMAPVSLLFLPLDEELLYIPKKQGCRTCNLLPD